jgi:hypothetical protein
MYKRQITYKTHDGETVTETFRFNLTKAEIVDMYFSSNRSLLYQMEHLTESEDRRSAYMMLKRFIAASYGVRDQDTGKFIKSNEHLEAFLASEAYSNLMMELYSDPVKAAEFLNAVVPSELLDEVRTANKDKAEDDNKQEPIAVVGTVSE